MGFKWDKLYKVRALSRGLINVSLWILLFPLYISHFFYAKQVLILSWKTKPLSSKRKKKKKENMDTKNISWLEAWGGMKWGGLRQQWEITASHARQSLSQSLMKSLTLRNQTGLLTARLGHNERTIYVSSAFCLGYPKHLLPGEALS